MIHSRRVVIFLALLSCHANPSGSRDERRGLADSRHGGSRLATFQLEKNYHRFLLSRMGYSHARIDWEAIAVSRSDANPPQA